MADTIANVRANIRDHPEEATASYWTDAEIYRAIVRRYRKLWTKIISIRKDWFQSTAGTLTPAAGPDVEPGSLRFIQRPREMSPGFVWRGLERGSHG